MRMMSPHLALPTVPTPLASAISPMFRGFIVGFIMVPAGMLAAEAMIHMPFETFLLQFVPILAVCLVAGAFLPMRTEAAKMDLVYLPFQIDGGETVQIAAYESNYENNCIFLCEAWRRR